MPNGQRPNANAKVPREKPRRNASGQSSRGSYGVVKTARATQPSRPHGTVALGEFGRTGYCTTLTTVVWDTCCTCMSHLSLRSAVATRWSSRVAGRYFTSSSECKDSGRTHLTQGGCRVGSGVVLFMKQLSLLASARVHSGCPRHGPRPAHTHVASDQGQLATLARLAGASHALPDGHAAGATQSSVSSSSSSSPRLRCPSRCRA